MKSYPNNQGPSKGELQINAPLDYETMDDDKTYALEIRLYNLVDGEPDTQHWVGYEVYCLFNHIQTC